MAFLLKGQKYSGPVIFLIRNERSVLPKEIFPLTRFHGSRSAQLPWASRDGATHYTRCSCTTIRIKWAYGRRNLLAGRKKWKVISQGKWHKLGMPLERLWTEPCRESRWGGLAQEGSCTQEVQIELAFLLPTTWNPTVLSLPQSVALSTV